MISRNMPPLAILAAAQLILFALTTSISLAQDWAIHKPQGILKVVDFYSPSGSAMLNYAEGLVNVDKDGNLVPCLARDWRWIDRRTIEFKVREGVRFHNGERFNAEAVRVNWEEYRRMESTRTTLHTVLPDETVLEVINEYRVPFTLPEPDGLAFVKFRWFFLIAPAFFKNHEVPEKNWVYLLEAGPWALVHSSLWKEDCVSPHRAKRLYWERLKIIGTHDSREKSRRFYSLTFKIKSMIYRKAA